MGHYFGRATIAIATLVGQLVGCSADVAQQQDPSERDPDGEAVAASDGSRPLQSIAASVRCNGTPLPTCDGPFTGATCDLPCSSPAGESASGCGLDVYCHSDGTVYGLSTRNAVLHRGNPDDDDAVVEAAFEQWVVGHAADLGLEGGLESANLELQPLASFRAAAGPLTIFRFSQTYHGVPVLAPDGIVTLVYGPDGAVSMSGAIVDNRVEYRHRHRQASREKAEKSILAHASAEEGTPATELELEHATLVAIPAAQAIGWVGLVRGQGGGIQARVIVDAHPNHPGPVLPLLGYQELGAAELVDTQPIEVRTLDPGGEPGTLTYDHETTLTTDAPLLGSEDDVSSQTQLANERVVVLDMHGARHEDLRTHATRITDPDGVFLGSDGTALAAQVVYHLFQSWYDFIDQRLTDPETGAKHWDSASAIASFGGVSSDAPPGTYAPRVLVEVDIHTNECPANGTACVTVGGYSEMAPEVTPFPELLHIPAGATQPEALGQVKLPGDGIEPVTFAHELGHVIDLFTAGGMTLQFAPTCVEPCAAECMENTTDEVPPLTESIAQLLAFVFLRQGFAGVDFEHCDIVDLVSRNGSKAWTPGSCIPPGEDISRLQRAESCALEDREYCDKPQTPGFRRQCCSDGEDPTGCTILVPGECEVGTVGAGGVLTGWARPVPTGMCDASPGYRTNSLYQAFWQLLNGQHCESTAPFACESMEWAPDVSPHDATTDALLYALRVNALSYEQLIDAMAMYVSCTYGNDAYEHFNAIACNHGLRDCDLAPPMSCESCGNGVREGNEQCDGNDWLVYHCEDLPEHAGGTLTCNEDTCMLDESQCSMPGLDTTAGTGAPPEEPSGSSFVGRSADTDDDDDGTGRQGGLDDDGGCSCRASTQAGWLLLVVMLGARRRRKSA